MNSESLLHLCRLVSPILPIGGFSYSRGLESAVHHGWVTNEAQTRSWIFGMLEHGFSQLDGPLFLRLVAALKCGNTDDFHALNDWLLASRESRELQMEDRLMGEALHRLLADLGIGVLQSIGNRDFSFPTSFALAVHHWKIEAKHALAGLMWIVVEGQVSAAMRLVPLGQLSGQRIMIGAVDVIRTCVRRSEQTQDAEIGNTNLNAAMLATWHEKQYSRLFRS